MQTLELHILELDLKRNYNEDCYHTDTGVMSSIEGTMVDTGTIPDTGTMLDTAYDTIYMYMTV